MGKGSVKMTMTPDEFLEWEILQDDRYEFVGGELFCHSGARKSHNLVAGNIFGALHTFLKGTLFKAFISEMKLQVNAADAFFYPDVMVSCDERDARADLQLEHPCLIVEVLADATAAYDLGQKFEFYRLIPELREYVVVEPKRQRVYRYRKQGDGDWLFHDLLPGESLSLSSVGCAISREDIFEGVLTHEEV